MIVDFSKTYVTSLFLGQGSHPLLSRSGVALLQERQPWEKVPVRGVIGANNIQPVFRRTQSCSIAKAASHSEVQNNVIDHTFDFLKFLDNQ